jgi:hypothetical protein
MTTITELHKQFLETLQPFQAQPLSETSVPAVQLLKRSDQEQIMLYCATPVIPTGPMRPCWRHVDAFLQEGILTGKPAMFQWACPLDVFLQTTHPPARCSLEGLRGQYLPNPHIEFYNCAAEGYALIRDALRTHDFARALMQAVIMTGNLNTNDTVTMRRFNELLEDRSSMFKDRLLFKGSTITLREWQPASVVQTDATEPIRQQSVDERIANARARTREHLAGRRL